MKERSPKLHVHNVSAHQMQFTTQQLAPASVPEQSLGIIAAQSGAEPANYRHGFFLENFRPETRCTLKKTVFTALIAACAVISSPAITQAAFTVTVSDTHGNTHTFTPNSDGVISGATEFAYGSARLLINVSTTTNSPGVG